MSYGIAIWAPPRLVCKPSYASPVRGPPMTAVTSRLHSAMSTKSAPLLELVGTVGPYWIIVQPPTTLLWCICTAIFSEGKPEQNLCDDAVSHYRVVKSIEVHVDG
jgi:hypothetical protein